MNKTQAQPNQIPVIVTTEYKGVFFGYLDEDKINDLSVTISQARMIVYWPSECHGVYGLAADGPKKGCKIGPAVPSLTLHKVTAIAKTTAEAAAQFQKEFWN